MVTSDDFSSLVEKNCLCEKNKGIILVLEETGRHTISSWLILFIIELEVKLIPLSQFPTECADARIGGH